MIGQGLSEMISMSPGLSDEREKQVWGSGSTCFSELASPSHPSPRHTIVITIRKGEKITLIREIGFCVLKTKG